MSKNNISLLATAIIAALTPFVEAGSESASEIVNDLKAGDETDTGEIKGPWALASCKEFYIPWNEAIHTGSKNVSKDGTFGRRRNLEDDFFITTEGAHVDSFGLDASLHEMNGEGVPQAVELSEEELEQVKDEKPSKPGKKTPPSKPGKKTPPSKPGKKVASEESALRKETIVFVNTLTKQHDVDYDTIIEALLTPLDVESFEDLPEENYKTVHRDAKAWVNWYSLISDYKVKLEAFDAKHNDDLVESFTGLTDNMNQLIFSELSDVYDEVKELHEEWSSYYTSA